MAMVLGLVVLLNGGRARAEDGGHSPWVVYEPGDLPIVLLAPHGGRIVPEGMATMAEAKGRDSNTDDLARAIAAALTYRDADGKEHKPYLVVNLLHRKVVEPNRSWAQDERQGWVDASGKKVGPDARAVEHYRDFHARADEAVQAVQRQYGAGLLLDIHGLAASRKLDMYGYLIRATDLHADDKPDTPGTDDQLAEALRTRSTLRFAASRRTSAHERAELVRGPTSLSSLVDAYYRAHGHPDGRPATPSLQYPNPKAPGTLDADVPYFNGSYDIAAHSSNQPGVHVDAVQIETTWDVRRTEASRQLFAEALADAVRQFVKAQYGLTLPGEK